MRTVRFLLLTVIFMAGAAVSLGELFRPGHQQSYQNPGTAIVLAAKEDAESPDVQLLRMAGLGTDDASLHDYLRKRSDADDDLPNLEGLIRDLGANNFRRRELAEQHLIAHWLRPPEPWRGLLVV